MFRRLMNPSASTSTRAAIQDLAAHPDEYWNTQSQTVLPVTPVDPHTPKPADSVRLVCISDTHNQTRNMKVPDGDILIHAGDFTNVGNQSDITAFNEFLRTLPHKHKVVIAGNHDLTFDEENFDELVQKFGGHIGKSFLKPKENKALLTNCIYLEDSFVEIEGFKIYGAPWQPEFFGWGFNLPRGAPLREKWAKIPSDTDILITHGPPVGFGDLTSGGNRAGCVDLLDTIQNRVKPIVHVFGHIHEGYGVTKDAHGTLFVNASSCTLRYRPTNPPVVIDLPRKKKEADDK